MKILIALILMTRTSSAVDKPTDPIVGQWRWFNGYTVECRAGGVAETIASETGAPKLEGKWDRDPFDESRPRYMITWSNGKYQDDFVLSNDLSLIKGKTKDGREISAAKVKEHTLYIWCNDFGDVSINGRTVLKAAKFGEIYTSRLFLKKGDVVAVELTNRTGEISMILELLRDGTSIASAANFCYKIQPPDDWKASPEIFGYRFPLIAAGSSLVMGNVKNPKKIIPQKEDGYPKKLYLKYVIP